MRKLIALLSAATAVAALTGATANAASDTTTPEALAAQDTGQGKLAWTSCNDATTPALQCAMLEVPVDYAHPHGRKTPGSYSA